MDDFVNGPGAVRLRLILPLALGVGVLGSRRDPKIIEKKVTKVLTADEVPLE